MRLVLFILMGGSTFRKTKVHLCKVVWCICRCNESQIMKCIWAKKNWNSVCHGGCTHQQQYPGGPDCARLSSFSSFSTIGSHLCLLDSKPQTFYFLPINFSRVVASVKMPVHRSKSGRWAGQIDIYSGIHFYKTSKERKNVDGRWKKIK